MNKTTQQFSIWKRAIQWMYRVSPRTFLLKTFASILAGSAWYFFIAAIGKFVHLGNAIQKYQPHDLYFSVFQILLDICIGMIIHNIGVSIIEFRTAPEYKTRVTQAITARILAATVNIPAMEYEEEETQSLITSVNTYAKDAAYEMLAKWDGIIVSLTRIIIASVVVFSFSPMLSVAIIIIACFVGWRSLKIQEAIEQYRQDVQKPRQKALAAYRKPLEHAVPLKESRNSSEYLLSRLFKEDETEIFEIKELTKKLTFKSIVVGLVADGGVETVIMGFLLVLVLQNALTISGMLLVLNQGFVFYQAMRGALRNINPQIIAIAHFETLEKLEQLNASLREKATAKTQPLPDRAHTISCRNISFHHPNTEDSALQDVTITFKPNTIYGIVGPNGSGKSTLIKIIANLYRPDNGQVCIDETDTQLIDPGLLTKDMAIVYQDFARYPGLSIRENIGISNPESMGNDAEIFETLQKTGLADFVKNLPNGMDTIIGSGLNGTVVITESMWRHIALARMFFKKDALVRILDNPTALMGPEEESHILRHLGEKDFTGITIIVSQQLHTILKIAQTVIVLENGHIVETGNPQELIRVRKSHLRILFEEQIAPYKNICAAQHEH